MSEAEARRSVRELDHSLTNLSETRPDLVDRVIQGLHRDYIDNEVINSVSPTRIKALAAVLEKFGHPEYAKQFQAAYRENKRLMDALFELSNTGKKRKLLPQLQQGIARGLYAKTDVDDAFSFYCSARHGHQLIA